MSMKYDRLLDGKTVWITGGTSPPYDVYARLFSKHGARIVLIDLMDLMDGFSECGGRGGNGGNLCRELRQNGGVADFYECDLFDSDRIEELCARLLSEYGAPDIYLHVADKYGAAYIDELDYGEFERMLAISVLAPFAVMKRVAEPMAARGGGSAVFVSGYYGVQGMNRVSGYGAAKGGEIMLAYSLAKEYAPAKIRVNAIVPGASFPPVGDDLPALSGEADTPDFWETVQPFRRRGRMDELANAALFLASDMSDGVTGEALLVDGAGHLIAHNHYFPRKDKVLP